MEIIIAIAIIGVGLVWYFNAQKKKTESDNDALAPYKVETPKATVNAADLAGVEIKPAVVVETAPIVQPEEKPAKAKKAPAKKTAAAKKPAAKKAPAKKTTTKKPKA